MEADANERAALLITVTAGTVAFTLGFNAGAFGTVFFDVYFTIWITASAVLIGSLISKLPPQFWWGRALLLLPSLWILVAWVSDPAGDENAEVLFGLTVAMALICLPFIVWVLASAINPDFVNLPRPDRIAVIVGVLIFALVGYGIGARNDVFLNCDDFKVSGNDLPENCTPGPNTPNPGE
jgi:hypothetical protein